MNPAAKAMFMVFSQDLEGIVTWLYADALGLLTTGMGNLVNSLPEVTALPWKRQDGTDATRDEVVSMYAAVRAAADEHKAKGGGYFQRFSLLRLTLPDVQQLVDRKLESNHLLLSRRFPDIDQWPADAVLGIHSWAWAVGTAAPYPKMSAALRREAFAEAANECKVTANGMEFGTLVERNRRNRILFQNAARVQQDHLDPGVVYWPEDLQLQMHEAETQPEIRLDDPKLED